MKISWPKGRYNGLRIIGITFKAIIDVTTWRLIPLWPNRYGSCLHWLCVMIWIGWEYESVWTRNQRESKSPPTTNP